jgi:hypothetical protein
MAYSEQSVIAPVTRHPLGLPPGSVRAVLSLIIVGLFWLLLLLPPDRDVQVPLYLYFLLGLVLLFFVSHGHSIAPLGTNQRSPLGLPKGSIRAIILLGTAAVVGSGIYSNPDLLIRRLAPAPEEQSQWAHHWAHLLMALLGGFFLGWVMRLGPWKGLPSFQDIQAWVSLLAMAGLGVEIVIRVFINPQLEQDINLPLWEEILVGIVSFYFGVRS